MALSLGPGMNILTKGASVELEVQMRGRVLARSTFKGDLLRIGRSPESDVYIDNPGLSRFHATLRRDGGVWTVEDLHSAGGTYVNGQRIKQWHLGDGDRIGIGKFTIVFRSLEPAPALPVRVEGGRTVAVQEELDAPRKRDEATPVVARLALAGGREVAIERDVFTIGGATDCDLVLPGWMVPDRVALVTRGLAGFSIVNLCGDDWVFVDGRPVEWESWLVSGNAVYFGRTRATFIEGAAVPEESETCPT